MAAKKPIKSTKSPEKPLKERAVAAALDLAGRMGWDMVTMTDIADVAQVGLAELSEMFDDKNDVLDAYGRMIDRAVLSTCAGFDPSTPEKDRLFELLMERFDALNENRAAVVSIFKSFLPDPKQAVIAFPHLGRSMAWMLEAAGIDAGGFRGAAKVFGLSVVYLNVLRVWIKDDTEDLSQTMAALDKNLARAEQCANTFML